MNSILNANIAPAKPVLFEDIPLIGGEFDGTRICLKDCAPTIAYKSKGDPNVPILYRRLDLDDGNGNKTILYVDNDMQDMEAFVLLVKGYKKMR